MPKDTQPLLPDSSGQPSAEVELTYGGFGNLPVAMIVDVVPERVDVEDPAPLDKRLKAWLDRLGLDSEHIENPEVLLELIRMETGLRGQFRWIALDHVVNKFLQTLLLPKPYHPIGASSRFLDRLSFPAGMGRPLYDQASITRMIMAGVFRNSTEYFLEKTLHFFIYGLVSYLLMNGDASIVNELLSGSTGAIESFVFELSTLPQAVLGLIASSPLMYGVYRSAVFYARMQSPVDTMVYQRLRKRDSAFNRFWRWVLPMPPCVKTGIQEWQLLPELMVWDAHFPAFRARDVKLGDIVETMQSAALKEKWFTQFHASYALAQLVYGVNISDLASTPGLPKPVVLSHIQMKQRALQTLRGVLQERAFLYRMYALYQLWKLGDYQTVSHWNLPILMFKGAKLYLLVQFYRLLFTAIIDAIRCPQKPGFHFGTGYTKWSSDYSQTCFEAMVKLFNQIPGQPAETLTDQIPLFDLRNMTVLDLSNKAVNGSQVAKIMLALNQHHVPIRHLNLSGNGLNQPSDFEFFSVLTSIVSLDFSNNGLGPKAVGGSVESVVNFSQRLQYLTQLQELYLAGNVIGASDFEDNNGTLPFGKSLGKLVNLRVLDLSGNSLGYYTWEHYEGAQAIGTAIGQLLQLRTLNLSDNYIDIFGVIDQIFGQMIDKLLQLEYLNWSHNGPIFEDQYFSQALGRLSRLRFLDMSNSDISGATIGPAIAKLKQLQFLGLSNIEADGFYSKNARAIIQGICQLQLKSLVLSGNSIGNWDDVNAEATQAIGQCLSAQRQLESLDLSNNDIGKHDDVNSEGTQAIGRGLKGAPNLQILTLRGNGFGSVANNSGKLVIAEALFFLPKLTNITIMPLSHYSGEDTSLCLDNAMTLINAVQQLPSQVHSDLPVLWFPEQVEPYFKQLCETNTTLNLKGKFNGVFTETWMAIGESLKAHCSRVTFLDLSDNDFACNDFYIGSNITQTIARGIAGLLQLISLDLSGNCIGNGDYSNPQGTEALGQTIGLLTNLRILRLARNAVGSGDSGNFHGTEALGFGIRKLLFLRLLDLSMNQIGYWDEHQGHDRSQGTQALASGIAALTRLRYLYLAGNMIGEPYDYFCNGTRMMVHAFSYLKELILLDISNNDFTDSGGSGVVPIQILGESLIPLKQLRVLKLANNDIGYSNTNMSAISIAKGLSYLENLCELNLDHNGIGQGNREGAQALLAVIPTLPNLKIVELAGIQHANWTQAAADLAKINALQLQSACQEEHCFGKQIPPVDLSCNASFDLSSLMDTEEPVIQEFDSANATVVTDVIQRSHWASTIDGHVPCVFPSGRTNLLHTGGDSPTDALLPLCSHIEPPTLRELLLPLFARSLGFGFMMGIRDKARGALRDSHVQMFEWGMTALSTLLLTEGDLRFATGIMSLLFVCDRLGLPLKMMNHFISLAFSLYVFKKMYDDSEMITTTTLAIIPAQYTVNRLGYYAGTKALFWVRDAKEEPELPETMKMRSKPL